MFKIPHRHFVISIPDVVWPYLKQDRSLWKDYMDSAIETCNDYFPKIMRNQNIRVGIIVIFHPYGKDMKFQPHLHLIITEGGFNAKGYFIKQEFIPARKFARCWQYHVSDKLQKAGLPNELFSYTYAKYDGFYVWIHKDGRIHHPKLIAKYLGRYVRHPAIANSRIDFFDGINVGFHYEDHNKERYDITMYVDEFISALVQHIPEPQFKMIRYYGAYARRTKAKFGLCSQSSIRQWTLLKFGFYKEIRCPYCGGEVEFVAYLKKPPPIEIKSQKELTEWISVNSIN